MSLFLASIGLALVLRQAIFLVAGPQPRSYDVDPYKVYVIGAVRLSGSQAVAIVVAAVAIVLVGLMLSGSSAGRKMRAVADDRALAAVAGIDTGRVVALTWIVCGLLAGLAGVLAALVQSSFDPNFGFALLLPIFAAVVLGGIGSAYGALLGGLLLGLATELSTWPGFHGGVNSGLQAGRRVRRPDRRAARSTAGACWAGRGRCEHARERRVLGVRRRRRRHLHAPRARASSSSSASPACSTSATSPSWRSAPTRWRSSSSRPGWSMWLAAPLAILAAAAAGVVLGLPTLRLRADYFAIATIAFSEIVRYVATNEDRLTGGSQGTINLAGAGEAVVLQRAVGALPELGADGAPPRLEGRHDARRRLGSSRSRAAPASGRRRNAVGPRPAGDPGGRGRRCLAGQERVRLQAAGARARIGVRRPRRLLLRVAVLVLQPGRLRAAAHLLRLDDRDPRRAWAFLRRAGRRARLRRALRRHPLLRLRAVLVVRLGRARLPAADA